MKDLYIIGAGGFGREVAWLVERINNSETVKGKDAIWNIKGFIDDNDEILGKKEDNYFVVGNCDFLKEQGEVYAVCAVGSAKVREIITGKLRDSKVKFATLIDPSVIRSDRVQIGMGTIICAGTILTVDIRIGNHVIINFDCTVGHDTVIKDFATVYPGVNVSGNVRVGKCCELGTGSQIIQGRRIEDQTIIGAGAVVVKDIKKSGIYMGVPAEEKNMMKSYITKDHSGGYHSEK